MSESSKSPDETLRKDAVLRRGIQVAKRKLDAARSHGDPLQIDLAEAGLNALLERLSQVTK